ncbi:MAG: hypothetical protein JWL97_3555, partial [Gemmatimonadales bacterium]|nr:hypothetical protein [Gemmatimonadales bacterium]
YGGTWGGDEIPVEVVHFELLQAMGWSWQDLQQTPAYVVRVFVDLLAIKRQAEQDAQERANAEARRGH